MRLQTFSLAGLAILTAVPAGASIAPQAPIKAARVTTAAAVNKTVTVTDAQNNASVTLEPGDSLIVRLNSNATTGYNWDPVVDPGFPLQMISHRYITPPPTGGPPIAGRGGVEEFRFGTPRNYAIGTSSIALWQRFLYLRPFDPGVTGAQLWQVRVILQPRAK